MITGNDIRRLLPPDYNGKLFTPEWESSPPAETEWTTWAKVLKQFATPEDKGIGDVIARMIGEETSEKFKAWHIVTFGRPCGCTGRQKLWNTKYPLTSSAT